MKFASLKKIFPFVAIALLTTCLSFGQTEQRGEKKNDTYAKVITRAGSFTYTGSRPKAKGSLYLYDNWNGVAVIKMNDGQKALVKHVNFNIDAQQFEAQYAPDSTYQFNLDNVASVTLNNKKYKQLEFKNNNKIFEYIYQESDNDFAILKSYVIHLYPASDDPMANRPNDVYTHRASYYVKEREHIESIHLNKKNILKIFKSRDISKEQVEDFMKENHLSYKDEFDVELLFKHFLDQ